MMQLYIPLDLRFKDTDDLIEVWIKMIEDKRFNFSIILDLLPVIVELASRKDLDKLDDKVILNILSNTSDRIKSFLVEENYVFPAEDKELIKSFFYRLFSFLSTIKKSYLMRMYDRVDENGLASEKFIFNELLILSRIFIETCSKHNILPVLYGDDKLLFKNVIDFIDSFFDCSRLDQKIYATVLETNLKIATYGELFKLKKLLKGEQ